MAVGACALALLGVQGLPTTLTPEAAVATRAYRRSRDGVRLRQYDDGMTTRLVGMPDEGFRCATAPWALAQAVPGFGRRRAVACMDSALHQGLLSAAAFDAAHDMARGRRGVARTHEWWSLTDPRAESPLETFARLDCLDAGVPPDDLQVEIRDAHGRFAGRVDMGWRLPDGRWLLAEIDGAQIHDLPNAVFGDRVRQNAILAGDGAVLLRFTARDLRTEGYVGGTVRDALRRLGRR